MRISAWLSIAVAIGMAALRPMREMLEKEMTREQIAEAQHRASEWINQKK